MTKIGALLRRLVWLRNHRPAEKSLVFSQWADALQVWASFVVWEGRGWGRWAGRGRESHRRAGGAGLWGCGLELARPWLGRAAAGQHPTALRCWAGVGACL